MGFASKDSGAKYLYDGDYSVDSLKVRSQGDVGDGMYAFSFHDPS